MRTNRNSISPLTTPTAVESQTTSTVAPSAPATENAPAPVAADGLSDAARTAAQVVDAGPTTGPSLSGGPVMSALEARVTRGPGKALSPAEAKTFLADLNQNEDFDRTNVFRRQSRRDEPLFDAGLRSGQERVVEKVLDRVGNLASPTGKETYEPEIDQLKPLFNDNGKLLGVQMVIERGIELGDASEYDFDKEFRAVTFSPKGEIATDSGWSLNNPLDLSGTSLDVSERF